MQNSGHVSSNAVRDRGLGPSRLLGGEVVSLDLSSDRGDLSLYCLFNQTLEVCKGESDCWRGLSLRFGDEYSRLDIELVKGCSRCFRDSIWRDLDVLSIIGIVTIDGRSTGRGALATGRRVTLCRLVSRRFIKDR